LLQNHYWKTSICTKLKTVKHTPKPSHFDQRAKLSSIYVWTYHKP
jgi:hypothetical protein